MPAAEDRFSVPSFTVAVTSLLRVFLFSYDHFWPLPKEEYLCVINVPSKTSSVGFSCLPLLKQDVLFPFFGHPPVKIGVSRKDGPSRRWVVFFLEHFGTWNRPPLDSDPSNDLPLTRSAAAPTRDFLFSPLCLCPSWMTAPPN